MKSGSRWSSIRTTFVTGAVLALQSLSLGMEPQASRSVNIGDQVIRIADDVPSDQVQVLNADLERVSALSFASPDPEMLRVMGIVDASSSTLSRWLGSRIGYVISENFELERNWVVVREGVAFPNPEELPLFEEASNLPSSRYQEAFGATVMSNLGTAIYLAGKQERVLAGLNFPGIGMVAVTSPRIGVVRVSKALVSEELGVLQGANLASPVHFGMRASIYFHEARHSDGHGKTLGFFHALCPVGHTLEGENACDRNLNGPYTVSAYMSRSIAENCGPDCTARDVEILSTISADSFDRVIRFTPFAGSQEAAEREAQAAMLSLCLNLQETGATQIEGCSAADLEHYRQRIAAIDAQSSGRASTDWDPAPEGLSE